MKTIIPCFLLIFIAYILQSSVFNIIAYDGISVDLILLLVIFFSIIYDKYAILYGFCAGLFQDLASGSFLGIHTLSLVIICILIHKISQLIYKENIFLPIVASVFSTFLNYFIIALFIFLLGYSYNIWLVINNMIIALIYNLVFAYPVYFIVVKIDAKLQYWIKRSEQF